MTRVNVPADEKLIFPELRVNREFVIPVPNYIWCTLVLWTITISSKKVPKNSTEKKKYAKLVQFRMPSFEPGRIFFSGCLLPAWILNLQNKRRFVSCTNVSCFY